MSEGSGEKQRLQDVTELDVKSLAALMIGILSEKAWQTIGLRVKPGTETVQKDLDEARLAIDIVDFLTGKIADSIADTERRRLESLVADLKLNFARIASRQGT